MIKKTAHLLTALLTLAVACFAPVNLVWGANLLETAAAFLGVSASPKQLKGPEKILISGEVWLANLETGHHLKISADTGYRSPLFWPGGEDILALKGNQVVRLKAGNGQEESLYHKPELIKLIGFHHQNSDQVLVLSRQNDLPIIGTFTLTNGVIEALPYDRKTPAYRRLLSHLLDNERVYNDKKVYVRQLSKQDLTGSIAWTDVFYKTEGQDPVNVSQGNGVNSAEPSLSHDSRLIVYIKQAPR